MCVTVTISDRLFMNYWSESLVIFSDGIKYLTGAKLWSCSDFFSYNIVSAKVLSSFV